MTDKEFLTETLVISITMPAEVFEKLKALAKRRYGDDGTEARNKVIQEACEWLITRWLNGHFYLYDWFWHKVAFYAPLKLIRAWGWYKLLLQRYLA